MAASAPVTELFVQLTGNICVGLWIQSWLHLKPVNMISSSGLVQRAELTQLLVEERGFTAVLVESDWPDAFRCLTPHKQLDSNI